MAKQAFNAYINSPERADTNADFTYEELECRLRIRGGAMGGRVHLMQGAGRSRAIASYRPDQPQAPLCRHGPRDPFLSVV